MKREMPRYKVRRMSKLLFGDKPVWGVSDTRSVTTVYTSHSLILVEDECNRLNSLKAA